MYAVIYFMIYTSPNEIQIKTGQLTCYFQHRCCTRDIQAPFQISRLEKGTNRGIYPDQGIIEDEVPRRSPHQDNTCINRENTFLS